MTQPGFDSSERDRMPAAFPSPLAQPSLAVIRGEEALVVEDLLPGGPRFLEDLIAGGDDLLERVRDAAAAPGTVSYTHLTLPTKA